MRILHLIGIALLSVCAATGAATQNAAPGPRLLAVEKGGRLAFFLPETHIGTPAQRDSYFEKTIRPAFAASSMLLLENAADPRLDSAYHHRACADEGAEEASLDSALNAAVAAHPASALERIAPLHQDAAALGRFMRVMLLMRATNARDRADPALSTEGARSIVQAEAAQSGRLMMVAPRAFRSVDDTASLFAAYCGMAPAQRAALIRAYLGEAAPGPQQPALKPAQTLRLLYRDTDQLYGSALQKLRAQAAVAQASAPAPEEDEQPDAPEPAAKAQFLITQRNRGWVAQLPAVLAQEQLPFYAIGAAHFVDGPHQTGLISLLRAQGYRVGLVKGPADLHTLLARMPAGPPSASARAQALTDQRTLDGRCVRVAGNYNCSWSDAAMLYSATALSPDSDEELLTVCYPRAAFDGTHNTCIVARMARLPRRGADLAGAETLAPPAPSPPI